MKMKKWLKCLLMAVAFMMVVNVGAVSTAVPVSAKAKVESVKKGKTFTKGGFRYKVTSLKGKKGTATLIGSKSKKLTSVKVPETVKVGKYTLTVNAIGSNAFKNCKKLKAVTTNTKLKKIGKNAFSGCRKLKTLDIRSTKLGSVGKNALKGISKQAVVTVPEGMDVSYEKMLKMEVVTLEASEETEAPSAETSAVQTTPKEEASSAPTETETKASETEATEKETAKTEETKVSETKTTEAQSREFEAPAAKVSAAETTKPEKAGTPSVPTAAQTKAPAVKAPETTAPAVKAPETKAPAAEAPETKAPAVEAPETKVPAVKAPETKTPAVEAPEAETSETKAPEAKESKAEAPKTCGNGKHLGLVIVESVAPTCTDTGLSSYEYCTVCDYETQPIVLSKLGHEMVLQPGQEATCTAQGWKAYNQCQRCGYHEPIEYVKAHGHSYDEKNWKEELAATCTTAGIEENTCTFCGAKQTRTIAAKGHSYGEWEWRHIDGSPCYDTNERECDVCGAVEKGHDIRHREGVMVNSKPDVEPTCTTAGRKNIMTCPYCGLELYDYVKPLGHNFCTPPTIEEGTCIEDGISYRKCIHEGCNERTGVKKVSNPENHKWKPYEEKATCTQPAASGWECELCGKKLIVVSAQPLGHQYETKEVEATCVKAGLRTETCSVCGDTKTTEIPATGKHKWASAQGMYRTLGLSAEEEADWKDVFVECTECGRKTLAASKAKSWNTGTDPNFSSAAEAAGEDSDGIDPESRNENGWALGNFIEFNLFIAPKGSDWTSCQGTDTIRGSRGFFEIWLNGQACDCYFFGRRCTKETFANCAPRVNGSSTSWKQITGVADGLITSTGDVNYGDAFYKADGCIYIAGM